MFFNNLGGAQNAPASGMQIPAGMMQAQNQMNMLQGAGGRAPGVMPMMQPPQMMPPQAGAQPGMAPPQMQGAPNMQFPLNPAAMGGQPRGPNGMDIMRIMAMLRGGQNGPMAGGIGAVPPTPMNLPSQSTPSPLTGGQAFGGMGTPPGMTMPQFGGGPMGGMGSVGGPSNFGGF